MKEQFKVFQEQVTYAEVEVPENASTKEKLKLVMEACEKPNSFKTEVLPDIVQVEDQEEYPLMFSIEQDLMDDALDKYAKLMQKVQTFMTNLANDERYSSKELAIMVQKAGFELQELYQIMYPKEPNTPAQEEYELDA